MGFPAALPLVSAALFRLSFLETHMIGSPSFLSQSSNHDSYRYVTAGRRQDDIEYSGVLRSPSLLVLPLLIV
jgi:hypothetical protein